MSGWGTIYNNAHYALQRHTAHLARLQQQASTGMRILRPSEAPNDAHRILGLRARGKALGSFRKNLQSVTLSLENASDVLQEVNEKIARARTLMSQVASGTYSAQNRSAVEGEIDALLEQIVTLANTDSLGEYIFGGETSDRPPFEVQRQGGKITAVEYTGSSRQRKVPVSETVSFSGVLVGSEVFAGDNRRAPMFLGDTGAQPGSGTSSITGDAWLRIERTGTAYAPLSGLAPGTSTDQDTIFNEHTLHVDGPGGTIRLDGGSVKAFNGTETNLKLTNADGDVVFVDTTGFNMADSGSYDVTGEGAMSLEGGGPAVPIRFNNASEAVRGEGPQVLYVDARNITRPGVEPVSVPGTYDVFASLIHARDLLANKRSLEEDNQIELISQAVVSLDEVSQSLAGSTASVGARLQAMNSFEITLENLHNMAGDQEDELVSADIVEVATDLARTQTLYEMSLTTASSLLGLSLLDFIA